MASQAPGLPPGFVLDPVSPQVGPSHAPVTIGTPRPRLPPAQTDVNAERDRVALERERQQIAAQRLQMERDALANAQARRTSADPAGDAPATQRRDAGFYLRALRANDLYRQHQVEPRGVIGQTLADAFPRIGNATASSQRQVAEAAQADFIGATLRYESGAAVPPAELEQQRMRYFPQPGDGPEVIALKAELRRNAIEALQRSAGPAANGITDGSGATDGGPVAHADTQNYDPNFTGNLIEGGVMRPSAPDSSQPPPTPDFPRQIASAPEGSPERLAMLERLHNALADRSHADVQVRLGNDPNAPFVNQFGLTDEETRQLEAEYQRSLPIIEARRAREQFASDHPFLAGADTFVRSAGNAVTLGLADRANAAVTGTTPEQEHAITASDWENRPLTSFGGTLAGGAVLPLGGTAVRQAGLGGLYGGTYNYFASDGTQGERVQNALLGAGLGAGATTLVNSGLRAVGRSGGRGNPSNVELVQGAQRQGVDLMPADLGNPTVARITGGARQTIGGAGPVARGAQRTEQQVGARVNALARAEGTPVQQEVLGDVVRNSLENYSSASGEHGRRLYANARDLSHDTLLQGGRAFRNINSQIRELSETGSTSAPLIHGLERLRADIASDEGLRSLSVDAIRRLRTNVRAEAQTDALRGTDYQRRAKAVLDELSGDIERQLPRAAAREFRQADRAWQDRLDFIDDVEANILGPRNDRSAEAVARRLLNMTRADSGRLARVLDTVSAEEARMIRGSAIENLGHASSGSPNVGGFSMDTFLTHYDALPARTRALLFRGQSRQDVEDLIAIARARRVANQSGNFSGTAGAVNVSSAIHNLSAWSIWGTAGMSLIAENLTGRLLASPRFVRVVTHPPREPGRALRLLRRVAVAEPALQSNIDRIIQGLQRAANDNGSVITRSAASGSGTDPEGNQQ